MSLVRERQGRHAEAIQGLQKIHSIRPATSRELIRLRRLATRNGDTPLALQASEQARKN